MSTVNAFVYVNPIEPAMLSMRVPSGIETRLELSFFDQNGAPVITDLLAQLELTARSGGNPVLFAVPTTDVVNGKARALLPAHTLSDPNGYRLRLYGTVRQELMLLATGVVDVIPAIGPTSAPLDMIDSIDLTFQRDNDVLLNIAVWVDATGDTEYDLGTATISAAVYSSQGGGRIADFAVVPIDKNEVQLTLPAAVVNVLPAVCWWSMVASTAAGMMTLAEGGVTVTGEIAQPLPVTIDNWTYLKPATADDPLSGQIIHSNIAQGTLKISAMSQPGTDRVPLLSAVAAGDRITVGTTTWVVRFIAYIDTGWYEISITPIVQDAAASGVVPVKFEPPA